MSAVTQTNQQLSKSKLFVSVSPHFLSVQKQTAFFRTAENNADFIDKIQNESPEKEKFDFKSKVLGYTSRVAPFPSSDKLSSSSHEKKPRSSLLRPPQPFINIPDTNSQNKERIQLNRSNTNPNFIKGTQTLPLDNLQEDQALMKKKQPEAKQDKTTKVLKNIGLIFNSNQIAFQNTDTAKILIEAQTDQQYKRLKRNSRILIQFKPNDEDTLPTGIINPELVWRMYWDLFMMILVLYYAIVTPINIAFPSSPFNGIQLEISLNCFFAVDIGLQFFTTFKHEAGPNAGRMETSHRKIILRYLKGWFIVDVAASFPMDLILVATTGSSSGSSSGASINRLLRLVRSVKLMRILRMSRIWKRLLYKAKINVLYFYLFFYFCSDSNTLSVNP
ncbi:voltage-gated ion channel superfamily [Reticulomyxa filosa]|uniref:Voltage-gated ion channel superfamily n=1 Tax=Reticulomyxa filosa TaxID=46433 RepID=X6NXD1_RETFI|nr:voltage-gated ion channel superfamily [Reticulomyxa filosa]|eukprot:ETO30479.1 voltage-gated ion channel superfamily [Reticulomyxa filosa]